LVSLVFFLSYISSNHFFLKKIVPIIPDYLYRLQNRTTPLDDTYKFLVKNCSNTELVEHPNYFVRHPAQLRGILRTYCNWTVDWAMNKVESENKERTLILENVRNSLIYIYSKC